MKTMEVFSLKIGAVMLWASCALLAIPASAESFYVQHNLVSDGFIPADHTDPNLVNSWGIAFNPTGAVWIADAETGVSTLYDGAGNIVPLVVQIPGPVTSADPGSPTGIVFSGSMGFVVSKDNKSGPARFMFATEQGTIAAWAPAVDNTHAITMVDNSATQAIYKGLALGANGNGNLLYATDFHNGKIDVFDSMFKPAKTLGKFVDPFIPHGFAPFGIQVINGDIFVTYAKQDADAEDDVAGAGFGFVDVYDANGFLLRRIASRGVLNAPWGMTLAPASFGKFANALLVGNFGDGHINAYEVATGEFLGRLRGNDHKPITIEGLWGLSFGNGFAGQSVDSLFFTSGPGDEEHGLYGVINIQFKPGHDSRKDREDD